MIFWHPAAAAILVKAPTLSGVLMFSKMIVNGRLSGFDFDFISDSISSRSNIAEIVVYSNYYDV